MASYAENVSIWWRHHEVIAVNHCSSTWLGTLSMLSSGMNIILTSYWPRWRLKSPASRLFTQAFIQTQIKENIKAPCHWSLCGDFTGTGEFPTQRASYAENVSIWWSHHEYIACINMDISKALNCLPCLFIHHHTIQNNPYRYVILSHY